MIKRSDLNNNALEISSTAHTIRMLAHGDKMYFSAVDILKACGIKAPTKWMERNTSDRPDIVTAKFEYPVKVSGNEIDYWITTETNIKEIFL